MSLPLVSFCIRASRSDAHRYKTVYVLCLFISVHPKIHRYKTDVSLCIRASGSDAQRCTKMHKDAQRCTKMHKDAQIHDSIRLVSVCLCASEGTQIQDRRICVHPSVCVSLSYTDTRQYTHTKSEACPSRMAAVCNIRGYCLRIRVFNVWFLSVFNLCFWRTAVITSEYNAFYLFSMCLCSMRVFCVQGVFFHLYSIYVVDVFSKSILHLCCMCVLRVQFWLNSVFYRSQMGCQSTALPKEAKCS